jgi:hypothetical protein
VPTAFLVVLLVARIAQTTNHSGSARAYQILVASSFLIFLAGLFNQINYAGRHAVETTERRDLKRVAELNGWLVEYASQHHWRSPRISFDVISSWFFPHGAIANGYEQTREFVDFQPGLGNGSEIMGVDRSSALSYLAQSEFVILTTLPKTGIYPFYEKLTACWSDLKDWADGNLILARRILFDNFTLDRVRRFTTLLVIGSRAKVYRFPPTARTWSDSRKSSCPGQQISLTCRRSRQSLRLSKQREVLLHYARRSESPVKDTKFSSIRPRSKIHQIRFGFRSVATHFSSRKN